MLGEEAMEARRWRRPPAAARARARTLACALALAPPAEAVGKAVGQIRQAQARRQRKAVAQVGFASAGHRRVYGQQKRNIARVLRPPHQLRSSRGVGGCEVERRSTKPFKAQPQHARVRARRRIKRRRRASLRTDNASALSFVM